MIEVEDQTMTKREISLVRLIVIVLLVPSIILNLFFIFGQVFVSGGDHHKHLWSGQAQLSWTRRAAEEAEAVAAISCSGHGKAFLDGNPGADGKPVCECNACFGGPDCSQILPNCSADADSGNPLFLEPFWVENAARGAVLASGWHRIGYADLGEGLMVTEELEKHVRQLHAVVGNAVTQGRYVVFGVGSAQLLNAAVHALSPQNSSAPIATVVAAIPYYGLYKSQTEYFQSLNFRFGGDANLWRNKSLDAGSNLIEFVTSPNNPDGEPKKPVLEGPNVKTIYDRVYYWPHFTAISTPADDEIMLFSLSKLTGHAGSRFGWAVVKDEEVYERMYSYVQINTLGVSRDTQLRALQLMKAALEDNGKGLFEFGYKTLRNRWKKLNDAFSVSSRFSLQKLGSQYSSFFQRVVGPSPAYAWLKCEREEDEDCFAVFEAANITGRRGSEFSAEERYVRLSLVKTQDDFDLLLHRVNNLVSEEYNPLPMSM